MKYKTIIAHVPIVVKKIFTLRLLHVRAKYVIIIMIIITEKSESMFYAYNGISRLLVALGLGEFRTIVEETGQTYTTFHTLGTGGMLLNLTLILLICVIGPYLLCSVAIPLTYCKKMGKPKKIKSAELGDVWREVGKWHGVACVAIKAAVIYICIQPAGLALGADGAAIAAFFCVMGCMLPFWHKMNGSRGFESAAICVLFLSPLVFGALLLIYLIVLVGMRYATTARLFPTLLYPLVARAFMMDANPTMVLLSVGVVALMLFSHWKNIRAMLNKEEPRIEFKKKKTEES